MSTYLDAIIDRKRSDLQQVKGTIPLVDLKARILGMPPPSDFHTALAMPGIQVIAEIKKASPSRGDIAPNADHIEVARAYSSGGAAAISVLTEEPNFKGQLAYLSDIKNALPETSPPLLRKDFIVDPYQVYETRAFGADALLFIVAALSDQQLTELLGIADNLGLGSLVEVHDTEEAARANAAGAGIVGINNRNLYSFDVDLSTTLRVRPTIPSGTLVVSESGIQNERDVGRLAAWDVDAFLIGEALMRSKDPTSLLESFIQPHKSIQ